jgi:hypothetical protein
MTARGQSAAQRLAVVVMVSLLLRNAAKADLVTTLSFGRETFPEASAEAIPELRGSFSPMSELAGVASDSSATDVLVSKDLVIARSLLLHAALVDGSSTMLAEYSFSIDYLDPTGESARFVDFGNGFPSGSSRGLGVSNQSLGGYPSSGEFELGANVAPSEPGGYQPPSAGSPSGAPEIHGPARPMYSELGTRTVAIMLVGLGIWWWRLGRPQPG